jgi:hypothetical protein
MSRFWPFGRAKAVEAPVESARDTAEVPALAVWDGAVTWTSVPPAEPEPRRYCEVTRVKGVGEFHAVCDVGLKKAPEGGVVIRTGHWVV